MIGQYVTLTCAECPSELMLSALIWKWSLRGPTPRLEHHRDGSHSVTPVRQNGSSNE